jgi:hypothetical protein
MFPESAAMTPDLLILKRATSEMIKGVGGLEAAAGVCRVGKSVLSDNQSPNRADSFVAIDVVAELEPLARERSGWPHVTRALCRVMGGTFVPIPEAPATREDLLKLLADQAREQSDLTNAICAGLSDGKFDQADATKALAEVEDVIRVAAAMRAELMTILEGE